MGSRWFDFGGDTIIRMDRYVHVRNVEEYCSL